MGYALFFLAVVAACLLWSAAFTAAAARTMTGSAAEAEDVLQDLFVELTRGMPDLLERRHEAWRLRTLLTGDL